MAVGTYALTSLANLKTYLNISGTTNNTFMETLVDRATALMEEYTRRNLKARDYSYDSDSDEYDKDNAVMDGNDRDVLILPQRPVNSLTTLRVNEQAIDESTGVYVCGWMIDKARGMVRLRCYLFTKGMDNIELAYNAGYSTVPDDLEQACIEQAAWMYKQSPVGQGLLGVSSRSLQDGSINYTTRDILPQVKLVLQDYKQRFAY